MKKRKYIFIPLTLIKKQWASKLSTSPKEKLELGKVLKVEIGEIRAIAALVFDFFFAFQLTFLIAKRCHCSRKSMTNHFENSLRSFFFFSLFKDT